MPDRKPEEQLSERDRLITRPDEPLPTPLEPDSPEANALSVGYLTAEEAKVVLAKEKAGR